MDQFFKVLVPALREIMGSTTGALVVFAAVFLLVLLLAVPLYFMLRLRGPGRTGMRFQVNPVQVRSMVRGVPIPIGGASGWQTKMVGQPGPNPRDQFLSGLDSMERGIAGFYTVLLYFIMFGLTAIALFFYIKLPGDSNRDFLLMYGGVLYVTGMLWAASQLRSIKRRLNPQRDAFAAMQPQINVSFETAPQVSVIDNQALDRAQQHLDSGGRLDDACALIDPNYRSMDGIMQQAFQQAMQMVLQRRRKPQT